MISKYEKTNGVKLLAIVAIFAMVLCAFAIIPSESEAASSDTQSYSGILDGADVAQSFPVGTNVVIDDTLTISNGAKMYVYGGSLTVNAGVTINVQSGGELIIGNDAASTGAVATLVTINGTVTINGENSKVTIYNTDSSVDYKTSGVIINGTVSVVRGGSLIADETKGGSVLINNGGSLAVSSSGSRISYITGINVDLAVGGTFNLDGRVASEAAKTMTVTSYGSGDDKTTAKATITSGTVTTGDNNTSNLIFTTTSGSYTAYAADESTKVVREYVLNVEGTVNGKDSIALSSIESASVESLFTSKDAAKVTNDDYTYNDKVVGKVSISNLDIKDGSDFIVDQGAYVIVAGKLTVNATSNTTRTPTTYDGNSAINGTIEIKGTVTGDIRAFDTDAMKDDNRGTIVINGGTATMTHYTSAFDGATALYGAMWADDDDNDTLHISSLATAVQEAAAAGIEDVTVVGLNGFALGGSDSGSYIVDADLVLPDNITLNINCGLVISEGVTLTVNTNSAIDFVGTWSGIYVDGKLVDYDTLVETDALAYIDFEVMSSTETENDVINTYTSFAIALSETTSGTIYLYNSVEVDRNMTIPENVTVQFAEKATSGAKISFEADTKYTMTIDGTLYISSGHSFDITGGTVTVNNVLKYDAAADMTTTFPGSNTNTINGAYFTEQLGDDETDYKYITSVAFAATNSKDINCATGEAIVITGPVAMGAVTFTQGENNTLVVKIDNDYNGGDATPVNKNVTTGDITLVGAKFDMTDGAFTGTVTTETSTFSFTASKGAVVTFETEETVESSTTLTVLTTDATNTSGTIIGKVALTAGQATVDGTVKFYSATMNGNVNKNTLGILSVASGATLDIDGDVTLAAPGTVSNIMASKDISKTISDNMTFEVAGTVNVNGTLNDGYAVITGTLNVLEKSTVGLTMVLNDGTIAVADNAIEAGIEVMVLNGTVTGALGIDAIDSTAAATLGGVFLVMPGSDISGAEIEWDPVNNQTSAKVTEMYINGQLYASVYTVGDIPLKNVAMSAAVDSVDKGEPFEYFTDAAQNDPITVDDDTNIGEYETVYVVMQIATSNGVVPQGTGLALYIDNIAFTPISGLGDNNNYSLTVGSHTVRFDVKAGYDGANATITLNGQTVENGGTIEITADMVKDGFTLVANGAAPMDYTGGSSDDGMGLTEILLIILVILIVVMAIMVALRLMRS